MINSVDTLQRGLTQMGLQMDPTPLLLYIDLLFKWNQTYNLTAVRTPSEMIPRHLLDSLAMVPYLHGDRIADVGSGAGLPGIPLALYFKDKTFVLFESIGKKSRFLEMVVRTLALKNVNVVAGRVEQYQGEQCFDTVMSRAVGTISQLINWTQPLMAPEGRWLVMKSDASNHECEVLTKPYTRYDYTVPGIEGTRCIICVNN